MEASRIAPGWCLRLLSGAVKGRTIALKPGTNVLGSDGGCEVMLPGGDVQPRHLVFTVGEVVVTMQRLGTASARLNGEEMTQRRRAVVTGDVVSLGAIDFQLDRTYPAAVVPDDRLFAAADGGPAGAATALPASAPPARRARWAAGVLAVLAIAGLAVLAFDGGAGTAGGAAGVNLAEVERALAPFPEVQVLALPGGSFAVKGYVESRQRRQVLQQAVAPFGSRVGVHVHAADEMVEQARRYVGDAAVAVTYAGQGRLVLSGTVEDEAIRHKVRRLGEDLHPTVLVSDRLTYRPRPEGERNAELQAQWSAWQSVLPARMVSITDGGNGLRHIQLSNGSRYYEGSVLRSGAELKRIDPDGLVLDGGVDAARQTPRPAR